MDFSSNIIDAPIKTIDEDELGLEHYAKSLSEFIRHLTGPFTVALQGEWGSGKSSLMNLLHIYLSKNSTYNIKFTPIDINVWEFYLNSFSENFVSDVLTELVKKILKFVKKEDNSLLYKKQIISRLSALLKCGAKDLCDYLNLSNLSDQISEYVSTNPINDFRNSVRDILDNYNKNCINNFVFFIDDLDRISPKLAVELLEVFKNIFDMENCIFIIAVDYNIITAGLKEKLHNDYLEKANLYGAFFDKLIQLSFVMPTYSYDITKYLLDKLGEINYFDNNEILELKQNKNIKLLFFKALKNNPRQIKCLINSIYLSKTIHDSSNVINTTEQKIINLLLYTLQQAYPSVFSFLLKHIDFSTIEISSQGKKYLQTIKLDTLCKSDNYIKTSYDTIQFILSYIDSLLLKDSHPRETIKRLIEISYSVNSKVVQGLPFNFDGNLYTKYSTIQNKQGCELINRIPNISNSIVLDVGCGDGKITLQLLKKMKNCVLDAIDISDSQLSVAKSILEGNDQKDNKINLLKKDLLDLSDAEKYDVIFSNSTLHWVKPITNAYLVIHNMLKSGGRIYIHQGGLGTYNEIHTIAKDTYTDMLLKEYFNDWTFPASYPSKNEITSILKEIGFIMVTVEMSQTQETDIDTLIEDFTVSSLPAYLVRLPDHLKDEYLSNFKQNCKNKLDSVTAKRLYIEAQKY